MIMTWMLFAIVTGALFGASALAAAHGASAARRPTRPIWLAAFLASALWPVIALALAHQGAARAGVGALLLPLTVVGERSRALVNPSWLTSASAWMDPLFLSLWAATTLVLLLQLTRAILTLRRQRESWRSHEVDGVRVRLSHEVGPAVVGFGSMEIVLPEWILTLEPQLLGMVLRHEEEHRRGHDPRILFATTLILTLSPWNPVLWWCARRLRLAMELDCDARVLAVHERPERYGLLLMMMAQRGSLGAAGFAPALTNPSSNLERRIIAMRRTIPRFARAQLLVFSALAAAVVAVACSVDSPEGVTASKSVAGPGPVNDTTAFFEFQVEQPVLAGENNPAPEYPKALEEAKVEGEVLVQFVVNPDGRADMETFKVLKSSNDLFTQAVKKVLPSMRFVPAKVGGKAVRQLVQMPFGFKVPRK